MPRRAPSALHRHLRADFSRDDGVSEILGNVIMVALTVSMMGAFGITVFATVGGDTAVAPVASFTMQPVIGATSIDVRLVSGSSLELASTTLTLAVDGTHELANAGVLSPARAGTWSVGETLRIDLISATLAGGQTIGFFAADKTSGKAIGAAYVHVPHATSGTAILQNALTLGLAFDRSPLVADGAALVNATVTVTATHGLLLIDHVSLNLTPLGGAPDLRLYDDGSYPDLDAGDGIFTAPFFVADHPFTSLPGHDNVTLRADVVDVLGGTTSTTSDLYLTTPTPSKVGAGVVYRRIGSSENVSQEGYINLSAFAFRDTSAIDSDQAELRVSDLADSSKVWSALVSFANTGCGAPAVTSIVLRVDGVAGNVTYTPALGGCFLIDANARLNLANVPTSIDAAGLPATWNAVATVNAEADFQYAVAQITDKNEALISFFGDTFSSSPFARGVSQTDFSWAPPANAGPATAPDAITTLVATAGNALVDLAWTAPSSGGSAITSYNIYKDGILLATIPPGTSYQATGLTNGVLYSFEVRAVNGVAEAATSNVATATPRTVPGAPTVPAAAEGNRSITLTWTAPVLTGGSPIVDYHIYGSMTSGATTYIASTGGANVSFVVNGLTNGDTWFFNVTASNAQGQGTSSVQTSGTPRTIPNPPDELAATAGDARVTLTWTPGDNGGLALTNYFIYRGTTSGVTTLLAATGIGTNTSFIDMSAANGVTYYYNITTRNAQGLSETSNQASATPVSGNTAPSQPVGLSGESRNHTVRLTWNAPASDGGSAITSYKIYAGTSTGATIYLGTTGGTNRTFDVNSLTNGVLTFFNVTAVNAIGEGPTSAEASATPLGIPYPPTNLAAARGNGTATLTWNAPAETGGAPITNYHVYRGTSSGATTFLGATGSATPGYTATGLTNGATYFFNVTAVNAAGQSSTSNEASVVPATIPNPPATLVATPSDGTVTLSWAIPANGGNAISDFKIYRGLASGATTYLASTGSGASTGYVVTGLTNGVPYFFNVTAVNNVGESFTSNEATATPAGLPGAPQSLSATKGNGTVQLTWSAPASNGGSAITNYHVYRGTASGATTYLGSTGGAITNFLASGLTNGQIYHFNVTAANALGQGPSSSEASATPSTVPYPPTALGASASNGQVSLTWAAPTNIGGSTITGYNIYRGTASGSTTFLVSTGSTTPSYVATGLTNGVTYFFNVTAVNANGQSATSNEATATPASVPGAPTSLVATKGNGTASLSWSAPSSNGGSPLTNYHIYVGTGSGATTFLTALGGTGTAYDVTGLTNGVPYYFNVTAVNGVGQGPSSNEATATPSTVPLPPTNLAASTGNGTASLTWTAPSTNGGSGITGYNIYRGTASGATTFLAFTGSATPSYAATGLTNGVTYFFNVTAVNANGQSATSNQASVTPVTTPNPPASLLATGGLSQVSLSWSAGSDGGSSIMGYQIWRGGSQIATVGAITSYVDTTAIGGTSYSYQVRAVTAAGTSNPSNTATATPFAHTYASTTTSITGGTITNAANFARDNGGDVATLTETGTTTITSFPPSANDRHFNTTPNTWTLVGSSNVALTFPATGGNPGGAMLVRSTSGTWSATIENSFTLATAASADAQFGVDSYTTGGGSITFTLVKPGGGTVALGTNAAGVYTTTTATVAASDLSTAGTYILRVSIAGSGNNKDTYVDNLYLNVPSASNNQFGHELTLSGIPTGTTYTLEVRARQATGAENLAIRTPGGATLATIGSTTMTTYSVTITPTAGAYTVRLIDVTTSGDPTASTWEVDYVRVVTT